MNPLANIKPIIRPVPDLITTLYVRTGILASLFKENNLEGESRLLSYLLKDLVSLAEIYQVSTEGMLDYDFEISHISEALLVIVAIHIELEVESDSLLKGFMHAISAISVYSRARGIDFNDVIKKAESL